MDLNILFEDKYILAVEKPQGIPTQSDKTSDTDLMSMAFEYLKKKTGYDEPYIGLIHRIDRPVGGVVVFAKNKFANANISEQIRNNSTDKKYLTVVCGEPVEKEKQLDDYIKKLVTINMSKITTKDDRNAKKASLKYKVLQTINTEEYGVLSLVEIELYTGRHHQIRAQMSNSGLPIWGDNKYNKVFVKKKEFTSCALWSYSYQIKHPKTNEKICFKSLPKDIYPFKLFDIVEEGM